MLKVSTISRVAWLLGILFTAFGQSNAETEKMRDVPPINKGSNENVISDPMIKCMSDMITRMNNIMGGNTIYEINTYNSRYGKIYRRASEINDLIDNKNYKIKQILIVWTTDSERCKFYTGPIAE